MRTEKIELFKFEELSEEAKEHAIEKYREENWRYGIAWQEEIFDSLKTLLKTANIPLRDYELNLERSWIKIDIDDAVGELHGKRAMAWLENNLLSKLRVPFVGKKRWERSKYGYRAGFIPDCPFTGYCADDDYLDSLIADVKSGSCLKDCFLWLANKYQEILNSEYEFQNSDEYIEDALIDNEYEFTVDGEMY